MIYWIVQVFIIGLVILFFVPVMISVLIMWIACMLDEWLKKREERWIR